MSDLEERDVERPGIGRRTLIKRAAATGAVAWAAPTIIGSLRSPAGAVTGGGFPCSYATVVLNIGGSLCAVKVNQNQTTCELTNATSGDATFSVDCGATGSFNNGGSGNTIRNGTTVIPACAACNVTVSGNTITATTGTIVFAIVHNANQFCSSACNPGTTYAPACCTN